MDVLGALSTTSLKRSTSTCNNMMALISKKDVNKLLGDKIDSDIIALDHITLVPTVLNRQSLNKYTAILIQQGGFSIDNTKAISRTNTRFAPENSLIAVLASALEIAHAHYILVEYTSLKLMKEI